MSSENKVRTTDTDIKGVRSRINDIADVHPQVVSLISQGSSVQGTIQSKARRDNDINVNNPGSCPSYYFESEGLLVFDLTQYQPNDS